MYSVIKSSKLEHAVKHMYKNITSKQVKDRGKTYFFQI